MARWQFVLFAFLFFHNLHCDDEERVKIESHQVIEGDPLPFEVTKNCWKGELYLIQRGRQGSALLVAKCEGGVWRPAEGYKDRVKQDSIFSFKRTVHDDTGLYELTCDSEDARIDVFVAKYSNRSLTEGQAGTLPCSFDKSVLSDADSVLWEKNGETVLKLNLNTGELTYETGFSERNVRLYSDGKNDRNFSLILLDPQVGDGGDFFCSLLKHGWKGKPEERCAVRMEVIRKRDPDQTTTGSTPPPRGSTTDGPSSTENKNWIITAVVVSAVVILGALLSFLFYRLGWCPKPRGTSRSSGSSGPENVQMSLLNGAPSSSANGVKVANGVENVN